MKDSGRSTSRAGVMINEFTPVRKSVDVAMQCGTCESPERSY